MYEQPKTGFLRLPQIIGQRGVTAAEALANRQAGQGPRRQKDAIQALIPIGKSCWWSGVRSGRFPQPVKLAQRVTVWRASDIFALLGEAEKS